MDLFGQHVPNWTVMAQRPSQASILGCTPKVMFRKIRAPIKIKSAPPPPPQNPPPLKRRILWTWVFLQKERIFPGVHKIGAAISGPRIAETNFTDTERIFLSYVRQHGILRRLCRMFSEGFWKVPCSGFPKNLFGLILTSEGYFKISGYLK